MYQFIGLFIVILLTNGACFWDSDRLLWEQQARMNRYPLPSDNGPNGPGPGGIGDGNAVNCRMALLPSSAEVNKNGEHDPKSELGSAEHCAGQISTGNMRSVVQELASLQRNEVIAYVSMKYVPRNMENPQNFSEYHAQLYLFRDNHFQPAGPEIGYHLGSALQPQTIYSGSVEGGSEKYLLVCEPRVACPK